MPQEESAIPRSDQQPVVDIWHDFRHFTAHKCRYDESKAPVEEAGEAGDLFDILAEDMGIPLVVIQD